MSRSLPTNCTTYGPIRTWPVFKGNGCVIIFLPSPFTTIGVVAQSTAPPHSVCAAASLLTIGLHIQDRLRAGLNRASIEVAAELPQRLANGGGVRLGNRLPAHGSPHRH